MSEIENEIKRLSNLRQNKKKQPDRATLEHDARINVWKRQINISSKFKNKEEKDLAESLFNNYLQNYDFNNYNEITNVADLVFEEVIKAKIQADIDSILQDSKNNFVPDKAISSLHDIQNRIWQLKEKIGITKKDNKDDLTALQELEHKLDIYISFHRNEFTIWVPFKCKSCGKEDVESHVVRRRVKNFDILKHPAFCGRFLYNTAILDDVKKGLITKEQAAKYQKTSPSMIEWQLKNEHKIIKIDGINKDELDEFINNNPYLRDAEQYNEDLKEQIQ